MNQTLYIFLHGYSLSSAPAQIREGCGVAAMIKPPHYVLPPPALSCLDEVPGDSIQVSQCHQSDCLQSSHRSIFFFFLLLPNVWKAFPFCLHRQTIQADIFQFGIVATRCSRDFRI